MLTNFVSVYVPSTRHGTPITPQEHEEAVKLIASQFSQEFGGCTAYPATGYWQSPELGLIPEQITVVRSYYDPVKFFPGAADRYAAAIALRIKETFEQEAVTVETNDGIEFI